MSRIGKIPVKIPQGVEVTVEGSQLTIKGPKGSISRKFHKDIIIKAKFRDNCRAATGK